MTSPLSRRDLARALVLIAVTVGIWLLAGTLWRTSAWLAPPEYDADALETLARIKLIGENGLSFLTDKTMPRLGAPHGTDWSAYPMPDVPVFYLLGKLTKVFGLAAAGHLAILFANLTGVLVFYFCSRTLGHRPAFAAGAAVLFGFSSFNVARSLSHYSFTLSFVVPATLVVAWLVGSSRKLLQRRRWQSFCLATAAITATGSPYYGLMFIMLLLIALGYQALTSRRRTNLRTGAGCLLAWGLVLIACNYQAIAEIVVHNHQILVRNYSGTEIYGLRPIEMIVPPPYHRFPGASHIAEVYGRSLSTKGENFSSYLGVAGLAGVAIAVAALLSALLHRGAGLRPAHAPTMLFIIAFGVVGGLNGLLALTVTDVFRAGNRYSIYILAAGLYALAACGSRRWQRLDTVTAYAIAAAVTCLGVWDQMRPLPTPELLATRAQSLELDRQLGRELERALPPGAMVFQLPVVPFLEQQPFNAMADYEQFRPFLSTTTLRFSYGLLATDAPLLWQRRVARMPPVEMRAELEAAGFSALYLCRAGYPNAAAHLRRDGEEAGMSVLFDSGPHLVFGLHPVAKPKLPEFKGPNRYLPWDRVAWDGHVLAVLEVAGWFEPETRGATLWRWTGRAATCALWNPTDVPKKVRVHCLVNTISKSQLAICLDGGRELWRGKLGELPVPCEFTLELAPGETHLQWLHTGDLTIPAFPDKRLLGFRVADIAVEECKD